MRALFLICITITLFTVSASSQHRVIKGVVGDLQSQERLPFVSVQLKGAGTGTMADSSGNFMLTMRLETDTLELTSAGFEPYQLPIDPSLFKSDTLQVVINLVPVLDVGVVVKAKGNRGLFLFRRIVKHKPENDRYRFDNFSYELYNKLELDLNNVNREKLDKIPLIGSFSFITDNIDTTEEVPFLPVYITEVISKYYYQKEPKKYRELISAVKAVGTKNESVAKLLGGMDQNVNIYNNFIPVFDKQFVSPFSDKGDNYYNYKIADTQYHAGKRLIHFFFTGKHKGNNTFDGECWVHDTTFAIQRITLRLSKDANVNYVNSMILYQEYAPVNGTWFIAKEKMIVDVSPLGGNKLSFIGRKTTYYKSIEMESPSVVHELSKNRIPEEVIIEPGAMDKDNQYWTDTRFEPLSRNEQRIYQMIDTLMQIPKFRTYTRLINFIGTGYLDVKQYQIGPWQNWIYSNSVEGLRLRFDLGTNSKFSNRWNMHAYAAYGFGDKNLKGGIDALYLIQKQPRIHLYGSFFSDFDYGQNYFDEVSSDNLFAVAVRKRNVPLKYIKLKQHRFDFHQEWLSGFSVMLSAQNKEYEPILNLPGHNYYADDKSDLFNSFEVSVKLRFAYMEKFLENTFSRVSLGSDYPIGEIKYTKGISGAFDGGHDYHKLAVSVSNYSKVAPFGHVSYNLFAGQTFGTLPYMFLDIAPGNEIHYYSGRAYNMMNKFEYVHDRYAGFNFAHHFGSGLFRYVPLTRKLKFRQFWTAKALVGELSESNRQLNFSGGFPFRSLDGKPYLEMGTGVDNIFKVFRIDFIWKLLPEKTAVPEKRFGVFGSFRLSF